MKKKKPKSKVLLPLFPHICHESTISLSLGMRPWVLQWDLLCRLQMVLASYIFHLFEYMWFGVNKSRVIFVSPALPSIFSDCVSTKASKM